MYLVSTLVFFFQLVHIAVLVIAIVISAKLTYDKYEIFLRAYFTRVVRQLYLKIAALFREDCGCTILSLAKPKDKQLDVEYIRAIMEYLNILNRQLNKIVILGSGDGSLNKLIDQEYAEKSMCQRVDSFLWWKNHEKPALTYYSDRITIVTEAIETSEPFKCNFLLYNLRQSDIAKERENLAVIERWLNRKPPLFVIRLSNFTDRSLFGYFKELAEKYQGHFVGLTHGPSYLVRVSQVFFVNGPRRGGLTVSLRNLEPDSPMQPRFQASWPSVKMDLPVDHLAPMDMGATIAAHGQELREPRSRTMFYKEVGYYPRRYHGSSESFRDPIFESFMKEVKTYIIDFEQWKCTDNTAENIEWALDEKLDRPPKEDHPHHELLWQAYLGISEYLSCKGFSLKKLRDDELVNHINKKSSMGFQDRELRYKNMGDYIADEQVWRKNVDGFGEALLSGRPVKGDFHISVQRETRKDEKIRLVWSLCATARLFETKVFGNVDDLLHYIPFAKKGYSSHMSGDILHDLMFDGEAKNSVCDDIKSWDTRVGYSILCMESAFLKSLTHDQLHKKEIECLYRLYSLAVVNIPRKVLRSYENVLYQLQGQVISGRRVTYAMNSITNLVICLCRAAMSQGVKLSDTRQWIFERLKEGHTGRFGGLISGDDSVIIMDRNNAEKYANHTVLLNNMGFERKGTGFGPSKLLTKFGDVNFCSRYFPPVAFKNKDGSIAEIRYIPTKQVDEILMKKLIQEERRNYETSSSWAREQARNLLVEYFHCRTVRLLALAILSGTPRGMTLEQSEKNPLNRLGSDFTESSIIDLLNNRLFGENAHKKSKFRLECLNDLPFLDDDDAKKFELAIDYDQDNKLERKLISCARRQRNHGQYDDWLCGLSYRTNGEWIEENPFLVQLFIPYLSVFIWILVRYLMNIISSSEEE